MSLVLQEYGRKLKYCNTLQFGASWNVSRSINLMGLRFISVPIHQVEVKIYRSISEKFELLVEDHWSQQESWICEANVMATHLIVVEIFQFDNQQAAVELLKAKNEYNRKYIIHWIKKNDLTNSLYLPQWPRNHFGDSKTICVQLHSHC